MVKASFGLFLMVLELLIANINLTDFSRKDFFCKKRNEFSTAYSGGQ